VDLEAVRTFVAVAAAGQFQEAADELAITQQAVSKRIAALERELGVRLFTRTARGSRLSIDGQALLPHARELLRAEERAAASVRPGQRALRVDVLGLLPGVRRRLAWPSEQGLRRITLRAPSPVYPHSLIWRDDNAHPVLATLRAYLASTAPDTGNTDVWTPRWT
jgi:DNA-binding transcriptional LysR family regulator